MNFYELTSLLARPPPQKRKKAIAAKINVTVKIEPIPELTSHSPDVKTESDSSPSLELTPPILDN